MGQPGGHELKMKQQVELAQKAVDQTGLNGQKAQVILMLDCSGSMQNHYNDGSVQTLAERALALAMVFDDDQQVPVIAFDSRTIVCTPATPDTIQGYVSREIERKHQLGGGTNYANAMNAAFKQWNSSGEVGLIIAVTDGNADDRRAAEQLIRELSSKPVFWQWLGVGNESFDLLRSLDSLPNRKVDNAGFFQVRSPSELDYSGLLNEFPKYLVAARQAGVL